jgi:hypothetical protein
MGAQVAFYCAHLPLPNKQMTPLTHIPLVPNTFPTHFDKLAMDFGRVNASRIQKSNH